MNDIEKKFKRKFIWILIVISLTMLVVVSFMFYASLKRLHNNVVEQYEHIYERNENIFVKETVKKIIRDIELARGKMYTDVELALEDSVIRGCNVADLLYKRLKNKVSKKELQLIILSTLKREHKDFIVVDENGIVKMHPSIKTGVSIYNFQDAFGNKIFQIVKKNLKTSKEHGTFLCYYLRFPGLYNTVKQTRQVYGRLLYVKYFSPYKWGIARIVFYKDIEEKLKKNIVQKLNKFRYGSNRKGYVFVLKIDATSDNVKVFRVVNPNMPKKLMGTEIPLDRKDIDGKLFMKEMLNKALSVGEGFVRYKFRILGTDTVSTKITYIKYYPQWHWIIGTGYYPEIFKKELEKRDTVLNSFILTNVIGLFVGLLVLESFLFIIVIIFMNKMMKSASDYRHKIEFEEKFQKHLIESIPNPLIIVSKDGEVVNINRAFEEFFGIKKENLTDCENDLQIKMLKDDILRHMNKHKECINLMNLVDAGGKLKNIELHKSLYYDKDETPEGVICVMFDVTKQKEYEEELKIASIRDELTGLYNRRYFKKVFAAEIVRSKRYNNPLSVIMYDIDHFKQVNDTYGHQVGDYVLKTLSDIVKKHIRSLDFLFRIGGEEFVILLIKADENVAFNVAEKIRRRVENNKFSDVGKITISLGVAQLKENDTPDSLLKRADDALYDAKNSGRNNTKIH